MIPIHVDTDTRNPIIYNSSPSITLNNPNDDPDNTYLVEDVSIDPMWDSVIEPLPDRDGIHGHEPRRVQTMITIRGWVKATTYAKLHDKIRALNRAFDPVLNYLNDDSDIDKGFVALDFTILTEDNTNYTDGEIPARFYCTPVKRPIPLVTKFDGLNARFVIQLRCADPRMYLQTTTEDEISGASPQAITVTGSTLLEYPVYPIVEVDFATAPSGTLTIYRSGPTFEGSVSLAGADLAGSKTLVIDMQAKTVQYSDGTDKMDALSAGSRFFRLFPGESNEVTFIGFPSDATLRVIHRRAFV